MIRRIKKALLVVGLLICSFSVCSCGNTNDTTSDVVWKEDASKKLSDHIEPLDAGKIVIEDSVYDFPMRLDAMFKNGWKISENYENAAGFMLESGYATNEFEIYKDEDTDKIIKIIVVNTEVKPQSVQNCFIQNLHIDLEGNVHAMLPGNISKGSSKDDIMKSLSSIGNGHIKESANNELTKISVNFNGMDNWNCNLSYELGNDGLKGIGLAISDDNTWGDHSDFGKITDTKDYLTASFESMYHGNFTNYAGIYDTRDSAEKLYQDTLTLSRGYMGKYFDFDVDELDDDQRSRLDEITKKLLDGTRYTIRIKDKIAIVEVSYCDFLKIIDEDIKNTILEFSSKYPSDVYNKLAGDDLKNANREYFEAVYKKMEISAENINFGNKMNVECSIGNDNSISTEDWKKLDVVFLGFGEIVS